MDKLKNKKTEIISTVVAIISIFLPLTSFRMSDFDSDRHFHSGSNFIMQLFRYEDFSEWFSNFLSNNPFNFFMFWVQYMTYLAAILLLVINLIISLKSLSQNQDNLENSQKRNRYALILFIISGIAFLAVWLNNNTWELTFSSRLSIGYFVTLIASAFPIIYPKIDQNLTANKIALAEGHGTLSAKHVTLIRRLMVDHQEFQPERRDVELKFNWAVFLLSPFWVSIFRKEWGQAAISFFAISLAAGIAWGISLQLLFEFNPMWAVPIWLFLIGLWITDFCLAIRSNERFVRRLLAQGWEPATIQDAEVLVAHGFTDMTATNKLKKTDINTEPLVGKSGLSETTTVETLNPGPSISKADEILKLKDLLEKGALTEEEFIEFKQQLLKEGN